MLITFLLLAVLAIGTVSASDDVASDGVKATDDANITVIGDYDDTEHYIDVNEEDICIDVNDEYNYDEYEEIASINLPKTTTAGSFQILNGEEIVASLEVKLNDEDHWYTDDDEINEGTIYLEDFNLTKVNNGDTLYFKFFENIEDGPIDLFTKAYQVSLTNTIMKLSEIGGGMTEDDVDIQVKNINTSNPDENFTYVTVTQIDGVFIITVESDVDEDIEIFKENLNTTERPYIKLDENGNVSYAFGFSFTDVNNYINQNLQYADSFMDLIAKKLIVSGDEIYFELYEDDEETEIYTKTLTFNLTDGQIIFKYDDDAVEVNCLTNEIIMSEGWEGTEVLEYTIRTDIKGRIVIYLNDNETPAFDVDYTTLEPVDNDEEGFQSYIISVSDLNITQAGTYIIKEYFYDENGDCIYKYDEEDPEILIIREEQSITVGNITIEVHSTPASIGGNDPLITIIDDNATDEDVVSIYVDESEEPITITIGDFKTDDDGNYVLTPKELDLGVGEHNLNVTYKGINFSGMVELITNLQIEIMDDDITIYTTFNENFVFISLDGEDIQTSDITGNVTLTITDNEGTLIDTLESEVTDLSYYEGEYSYVIRTSDMNVALNGTYNVVVRYSGNKGTVQEEGNVTFKSFDPADYGTSIIGTVKDINDYVVTFTNITLIYEIFVEVNGNNTVKFDDSDIMYCFDPEKGVYYITYDKLSGFVEGSNSISVYISGNNIFIDLAKGNVFVDVEENIDPALTISVADIEQGQSANVVITTNSTFTGDVIVQVANKNYTVNVVEGKGSISISGLAVNTYTATAFFKSNGIFNDSTKTATFKVTSKPVAPAKKTTVTKLTLKKVKVKKSAKKLVLKATLKINGKAAKGKVIKFKFKGKTYKAKTNKKGVAKVTIKKKVLKKLKVGKKVKYQATYGKVTKKYTVKVKK
jgi:hypothetical protein